MGAEGGEEGGEDFTAHTEVRPSGTALALGSGSFFWIVL